jgi:hypothetical protein
VFDDASAILEKYANLAVFSSAVASATEQDEPTPM